MSPAIPQHEHPPAVAAARSQRQPASVGLAIALATAGVLPVFLTGALAVQLEASLHVGSTAVGGAVTTFFGASALSSVRGGRLAERVGPFKVMLVAVGLSLVALVGTGLVVTSYPALLGFLVVGGLSNGTMQPAVNLLLSRAVSDHRQGLAFGVKQAAIPTATLLSGLAVPALAITAGWHVAYLAAAGLVLLVGAVLLLGGRPLMPATPATLARAGVPNSRARDAVKPSEESEDGHPRASSAPSGAASSAPSGAPSSAPSGAASSAPSGVARFDVRPLVYLATAMACAVAASNTLGSFVVPGAVHDGVTPGLAGLLSAAGSVVGLAARVGVGWRADRAGLRGRRAAEAHLRTVAMLIAVGALGFGALAVGNVALLFPAVLVAYGGGWGYNGLFNLAVVRAYPETPARATGVTQVGTYVGGMVGPLGFGIVADHLGFDVGWALCGGFAVVAVAAFSLSRERLRAATASAFGAARAALGAPSAVLAPIADLGDRNRDVTGG
ncbi:MAG: MFS transporter [Acidimicrobiales bacterium]